MSNVLRILTADWADYYLHSNKELDEAARQEAITSITDYVRAYLLKETSSQDSFTFWVDLSSNASSPGLYRLKVSLELTYPLPPGEIAASSTPHNPPPPPPPPTTDMSASISWNVYKNKFQTIGRSSASGVGLSSVPSALEIAIKNGPALARTVMEG